MPVFVFFFFCLAQLINTHDDVINYIYVQYEKHEAKKDPEHAHRHKIEEEIAAAAAVGSGGYAFHEHHEKKKDHKDAEEASGEKKHHHLFG